MKLASIIEGHWEVAQFDYPNSLIKPKKKKSKKQSRISMLVDPTDRDNFFSEDELDKLDLNLDDFDFDIKPVQNPAKQQQQQQKTKSQDNEPSIQSKDLGNTIEVRYLGTDVRGYLHAEKDNKNPKLYRVVRVAADPPRQGYGKKLYLAAIKLATQKGAMLTSANNSTSQSATHVWNSLYQNTNIQKVPLNPSDWPESPINNRLLKNYPNLRYRDPNTYPPKNDIQFWAINSGYMS